MRILRALAAAAALCLCLSELQGCATPYQSAKGSFTGGFGEKRISDSAYWVFFSGNGYARRDRVVTFWLNRCAELTIQQGYQYMVLHPGENAPPVGLLDLPVKPAAYSPGNSAVSAGPAIYHPGSGPQLIQVRGGGGYVVTTYYGGGAAKWNSKGTVLMYRAPLGDELVWAYDAQKVLDLLKDYVSSDGGIPAPALDKVAEQSMVAHERIGFVQSAPPVAAPSAPPPAAAPAPARPPRSDAEIADWLEDHGTAFHALFRERFHLEHQSDAGTVSLSFSITPNGNTTNCQVVSTSFPDRNFADAAAQLLCKMTFAPRDVAQTDVPPVTISFTPLGVVASL